MTSARTPIR